MILCSDCYICTMSPALTKYQIRHLQFVKNKVAKAIAQYQMIDNGDKILVAVSGGKDSLVLLETLANYRKYAQQSYHLEALHVDMDDVPYSIDRDFMQRMGDRLEVKINFIHITAGLEERGKKAACFVCSWHRRKALFSFASENGFRKLAFGHHLDDAVETLLINMSYHGNISSIPGKLSMFNGAIQTIRPLILMTNKETHEFARIMQYPKLKQACPYENQTKRNTARNLIESLKEIHPKAKFNLIKSLHHIDEAYLP